MCDAIYNRNYFACRKPFVFLICQSRLYVYMYYAMFNILVKQYQIVLTVQPVYSVSPFPLSHDIDLKLE